MPTASRTAPTVLAAIVLLAACGAQSASYGGSSRSEPSRRPSGTPSALPLPSAGGTTEDGVKITALYAWGVDYSADFELTNHRRSTATYTLTFGFLAASGGAVENRERTVEAVAPGRTVKGTVVMRQTAGSTPAVTGVAVSKVRSVPEAEVPDAAMGLRVVGLHLVNCGTRPYRLNGRPELELQDADHESVNGVRILRGTDAISTGLGGDGDPQPVLLGPGEAAVAVLAWRNTTQSGAAVNAPYVRVWATPAADPVTVVPELDLGTTGKLGVGPWRGGATYRASTGTPAARP
ncbi:DUF4232 domain-containing protein [Streptomyces sp. NPDC001668]|uniref:DUF4232 domain-containing protein n=1 Tax=unclassified Streptomyces TaxID=2593676 RepID=UPI0036C0BA7E